MYIIRNLWNSKYFLIVYTVGIIFILLAFLNYSSNINNASNKLIRKAIAEQLDKDPRRLTKDDYRKIEELKLSGYISNLNLLSKLSNLQKLELGVKLPVQPVYNNRFIAWIMQYFTKTKYINIKPLSKLKYLKELHLNRAPVRNIKPLSYLQNLESLCIFSEQVNDIHPIKQLKNLRTLYIIATDVSDIQPLENLTNLQKLIIEQGNISNIKPISNLINLEILELVNIPVEEISPLSKLTNLQILDLTGTRVNNIESLKGITHLKKLNLNGTTVSQLQKQELQQALPDTYIIP